MNRMLNSFNFRFKIFKRYLNIIYNFLIPLDNYTISIYEGRFGNNIQQILNGVIYSKMNHYNFYSKNHENIEKTKSINNKPDNKFRFLKKRSSFFGNPELEILKDLPKDFLSSKYYLENANHLMKNLISEKIKFLDNQQIDDDALVIHIRSGEIFNGKDKYGEYVQNPLKFYEILIEKFEKILIVSENTENPVIDKLLQYNKVQFQSSTMESDFNTLYSAKNLATSGVGTFGMAAALMSHKLENLYCTDIFLKDHLNPNMIDKKIVNVYMFNVKNYIPIGNWVFNDENKNLMLSKNIEIKTPSNYL